MFQVSIMKIYMIYIFKYIDQTDHPIPYNPYSLD